MVPEVKLMKLTRIGKHIKGSNRIVFYVEGDSGTEYCLRYTRRDPTSKAKRGVKRFSCDCKSFYHDKQPAGRHCKHIKFLLEWAAKFGGIMKLATRMATIQGIDAAHGKVATDISHVLAFNVDAINYLGKGTGRRMVPSRLVHLIV
jgi:hypothetical protein